ELLISAIALGALLTISYFLFPPLVALSFINFLSFLNQMAVIINLFFLTKHVVVPPAKRLVEKIAHHMGFNIEGLYFSKPPLTLEDDRFVIDQLLIKTYGHDSFSSHFKLSDLKSFNKLLTVLSHYINKYDESFFGYLKNNDDITALEQQITDLTTTGNPDSSYTFIRKKIGYKTTKIQLLKTAEALVNKTLADETKPNIKPALHFFSGAEKHTQNINETLSTGILCIQKEIKRQEDKIDLLKECLPFVII
ncbi:MAG: hypothetical protein PSV35_05705, partial [bacterium]|nr:hypothetical protein [bacterium]